MFFFQYMVVIDYFILLVLTFYECRLRMNYVLRVERFGMNLLIFKIKLVMRLMIELIDENIL